MGLTLAGTSKSAEAPELKKGMYDARFEGVRADTIENSQFGDGDVFIWAFTLFEDGSPMREDREEHPKFNEAIEVEGVSSRSTNTKSKTTPKAVSYLESIMTDEEFENFKAEKPIDTDALIGRMVQVQIEIKDTGWPKVTDVLPAKRSRK